LQRDPGEGTDHVQLIVDVGGRQFGGQLGEGRSAVAALGNGDAAHPLDEVEHVGTGLLAHDVAQQATDQTDVVTDRGVFVAHGHVATG
jgi:hypothetical protein